MKKQKALAALLAMSMAAANIVNVPAFAYANAFVPAQTEDSAGANSNGTVDDTSSTVTLANTVTDGAVVWIDGDDSVTVKTANKTAYSKILKKDDSAPTSVNEFTIDADTGIGSISAAAKLYLLKTGTAEAASSITQKEDFILVEVKQDSVAPVITEVTAGGINYIASKDETAYVQDISSLDLSAVVTDDGSGVAKIEYMTADDYELDWKSNTEKYTDWSETKPTLTSGKSLCVKATDQVGNVSYAQTKKIVEDRTVPTISLKDVNGDLDYAGAFGDSVESYPITSAAVKLSASDGDTGSGIAVAKYKLSTTVLTDTDSRDDWEDFTSAAAAGKEIKIDTEKDNYLYVYVKDIAGNEKLYASGKITYTPGALTGGLKTTMTGTAYTPASPAENTAYYDIDTGKDAPKLTVDTDVWTEIEEKGFSVKTKLDEGAETSYTENTTGLTITDKGPHTVTVNVYDSNDVLIATSASIFVNMKTPETALTLTTNSIDYDGKPLGEGHGFTAIEGATYTYYSNADGQDENKLTAAPSDAGDYYVKATKPENLTTGDKTYSSEPTKVTINKAEVTKSLGEVIVKTDDTVEKEIDTSDLLKGYVCATEATYSGTVELTNNTDSIIQGTPSVVTENGKIKYQIAQDKADGNSATLTATYDCFKNYTVKLVATIKLTTSDIKELSVTQEGTTYGTDLPALSYTLSDGTAISADDCTIAYAKADGTSSASSMPEAPDAGDYMVTVTYTTTGAIATKTVNFTIAKKPITLTAKSYTINVGETLPNPYEVTSNAALAYSDAYTSALSAACKATDSDTAGTYAITVNPVTVNGGKTENYAFTYVDGTLTVQAKQQGGETTGGTTGGSTGGGTSGSSDSSSGGGTATKPEDTEKPGDGQTPTQSEKIVEDDEGNKTVVDQSGKAITNAKVVIDGKTYLTDEAGAVIMDSLATTPAGNTVFCGKDGVVVKNQLISVSGETYYAKKTGAIAKNQLVSVSGKKYYATKTGVIATSKLVSVSGKKYYATKTGAMAVGKFVTVASGKKVYCSKTGAIVTNKIFTVNGAKYIAKKSGVIYKSRWVTKGSKKYYVNKSGKVTKVKKIK